MLLYVYDKTITLLGIIEEITSLVWTEKKYTNGTFEMLLPASPANIELIQKNRLILRDDDDNHIAGEILYIKINKSVDGSEKIEVTGKLLSHWLTDRLILTTIMETQKPQPLMRRAVSENAISSATPARNYPLLTLGSMIEARTQAALNYKNEAYISVLAMCEELAAAEDTGFSISVDITAKRFRFNTYTGADHTINSGSPCIFSVEYENILEQEYTQSVENLKNVAYITGEEKSTVTMPIPVGNSMAGHNRKEVYINASSVKQETLTPTQYEAVLASHGELALEQYTEALNFYNHINAATSGFIYGIDYQLGDKVTCINTAWKIAIDAVITEAQTTYEDGQKTIYLTFGQALPTLFNKIKNLIKR